MRNHRWSAHKIQIWVKQMAENRCRYSLDYITKWLPIASSIMVDLLLRIGQGSSLQPLRATRSQIQIPDRDSKCSTLFFIGWWQKLCLDISIGASSQIRLCCLQLAPCEPCEPVSLSNCRDCKRITRMRTQGCSCARVIANNRAHRNTFEKWSLEVSQNRYDMLHRARP